MSNGVPQLYRVDPGPGVKKQIEAIAASLSNTGNLEKFVAIMKRATQLLQNDPHAWGDPEYRSKHVDALFCHAMFDQLHFIMSSSNKFEASFC